MFQDPQGRRRKCPASCRNAVRLRPGTLSGLKSVRASGFVGIPTVDKLPAAAEAAADLHDHGPLIRCSNLERTRDFYRDFIGLEVGPRPNFNFAGYWLYCGGVAVVNLMKRRRRTGPRPTPAGSITSPSRASIRM